MEGREVNVGHQVAVRQQIDSLGRLPDPVIRNGARDGGNEQKEAQEYQEFSIAVHRCTQYRGRHLRGKKLAVERGTIMVWSGCGRTSLNSS